MTTNEDVAYVFQAVDFSLSDPNDVPPNSLSAVVISTTPASGTLALSGVPVVPGQAISLANLVAGNLRYASPLNANGPAYTTFTFRVRDDGGTAFGGVDTDPSANVLTVNVTPVNDDPVAVPDTWQLNLWYITGKGADMVVPSLGVLFNDADVDFDPLTAELASGPEHGDMICPTDLLAELCLDGSFTYTPDVGFHGEDSFIYRAYDGTAYSAPVGVTLLVDDPPVSQPDAFVTNEDTPLSVGAPGVLGDNGSGADSDPNGDPMTVQLISAPIHGAAFTFSADGSFVYTPALNYNGADSLQYRAFDGWLYGNTVTVSIAVTPVNDSPVAAADTARTAQDTPVVIEVLANDTDVEGGPLRVATIVTPPSHGWVANNGTDVTYTPVSGYVENDFFEYQVCDPGADLIPGNVDDLCDTAW